MNKYIVILIAVLLLEGCATNSGLGDYPLQYESMSSTLVLADGLPQLPGNGSYLAVSGYVFTSGLMAFHPGKRIIHYACPGEWEWQDVTHFIPWVEYTFEVGKKYELFCENGYPNIRLVE